MKRLRLFVRIASVFILDYYFFESESGVDGVRHSLLTPHYRFPSAIFRFQRPDIAREVDGALEPLLQGQRLGVGEKAVVEHDGVELIALFE